MRSSTLNNPRQNYQTYLKDELEKNYLQMNEEFL